MRKKENKGRYDLYTFVIEKYFYLMLLVKGIVYYNVILKYTLLTYFYLLNLLQKSWRILIIKYNISAIISLRENSDKRCLLIQLNFITPNNMFDKVVKVYTLFNNITIRRERSCRSTEKVGPVFIVRK